MPGLMQKTVDMAKKYKWPALAALGTGTVAGTAAFVHRKTGREREAAELRRILEERYGRRRRRHGPVVKHAGLAMEKDAFSPAVIRPWVGRGLGLAANALGAAGRYTGKGLRALSSRAGSFGTSANNYLTQRGWGALGSGINGASQFVSRHAAGLAMPTTERALRGANFLRRKRLTYI